MGNQISGEEIKANGGEDIQTPNDNKSNENFHTPVGITYTPGEGKVSNNKIKSGLFSMKNKDLSIKQGESASPMENNVEKTKEKDKKQISFDSSSKVSNSTKNKDQTAQKFNKNKKEETNEEDEYIPKKKKFIKNEFKNIKNYIIKDSVNDLISDLELYEKRKKDDLAYILDKIHNYLDNPKKVGFDIVDNMNK
jgi:hypothetical protein